MTSLPNLEHYAELASPELALAPDLAVESVEFEVVVGHRQVAGVALLVLALLAVFSGVSYLIGRSMAPAAAVAATRASVVQAPVAPAPVAPTNVQQTPAPAPALAAESPQEQSRTFTAPVFSEAIAGKVYLQVGIIEKGSAATWAEGLRTHGLDAFVAPGPSDGLGLWRVLIGPLPDSKTFQRAKSTLDALGVPNFGRTYQP
jgi:cell division septation protein DedD